jgi:hypothetical protein
MKTLLFHMCFLLLSIRVAAQTTDTTTVTRTTTTSTVKPPTATTTNVNINLADTNNRQVPKSQSATCPAFCGKTPTGFDWLLIFSPVIIFLAVALYFRSKLNGFSLKEALEDSEQGKKTIQNPEYNKVNLTAFANNTAMTSFLPPTLEVSDDKYAKSSSRYIALITAALTWTIGICLTCYFIYGYILTGQPPELNKLTDIVLTLGIGVVPYAFNKLSEAAKK